MRESVRKDETGAGEASGQEGAEAGERSGAGCETGEKETS